LIADIAVAVIVLGLAVAIVHHYHEPDEID
jgi:hypothetical protein